MSYSFQPMTDEEIDSANLIENGVYDFEVKKSTRKTSNSGNAMAALQLNVWDSEGKVHTVFDYLVFINKPLAIKKISHFCKSVGLHEEYKKGEIPEELEGYCGKVTIAVEDEMPKPNGGFYPKKNVVVDYESKEKNNQESVNKPVVDELNDDIPF